MRIERCSCGADNTLISPAKSYKCKACGGLMDWRLKIACLNCGAENRTNSERALSRVCQKCRQPLDWSVNPENHVPNSIAFKAQLTSGLFAALLFGVSIYAIVHEHLIVPYGRRGRARYEFFGFEIMLPVISLVLAGIGFLAIIIDHYDRRQNEWKYKRLSALTLAAGYTLYFLSIFVGHKVV